MARTRAALFVLPAIAALCLSASSLAGDWAQWRGPNRDGISPETGLLKSWPEGGPPRVWMFKECGVGYGGPAIVGDRLFILGTRDDKEVLLALHAKTGDELWVAPVGEIYEEGHGDGPRSTPTVDGNLVYALGAEGNLICAKVDSGDVVWTKSMLDLGGERPHWGYSESPFVYKNTVLCTPGGEEGSIAALHKATGDVVWQSKDITSNAHYSSIVLMKHEGHEDAVQLLPDQVVGFEPDSGKLLWNAPWPKPVAAIPTPVVRDPYVFVSSGYGVGCMLVKVDPDHNAEKVYENKVMKNKQGGTILIGDTLFGPSDGAGWIGLDFATGEAKWRDREAMGMGSMVYADGMYYCLDENNGDVALVEASPDEWKEHGRFRLEPQSKIRSDGGRIWVHPVIASGMLYLRDQDLVYCYDVRDTSLAAAR